MFSSRADITISFGLCPPPLTPTPLPPSSTLVKNRQICLTGIFGCLQRPYAQPLGMVEMFSSRADITISFGLCPPPPTPSPPSQHTGEINAIKTV